MRISKSRGVGSLLGAILDKVAKPGCQCQDCEPGCGCGPGCDCKDCACHKAKDDGRKEVESA
jgi:hypothetical protein